MIQLKITHLGHSAKLTFPAKYERVALALWTIGLDRDPEKYTLRRLGAEFSFTTEEESHMVRLIDPGNTLMQALCLLSEMMYPPHPVAEKIHKKMAEGGYASEEDFFIEMENFIYDSDLHLQRYYFPVSGEVVDKRGLVRQAPDPLLVKYELLISEAIHGVQRQISGSVTKLFEDVDGVYQKLMAASWSVESVSGFLVGQVILFLTEPLTKDEAESAAKKIETLNSTSFPIRLKNWSVLTDEGLLFAYMRHIASVFKLVQELLAQSTTRRGGNQFQELIQLLPADHKAKWLAGSALTASDQGMNSIMSTVLSKLNAFLDTVLEQVICFDGSIDAELFVKEKCAIFLILPEEDATKNFVASLMIQNLARELFSVANEHGGKLPNRAVFFCDELGTMPPFDILPLFSAGRSRRLTLVPIIQSLAQLEKNYGKEGSEIMCDNCQDTIFGGFAPNSQTAAALSSNLGSRTVLSGTVTKGKNDDSQSLQMMERPLMSPDELKSMPKGSFVVMKTGTHPMKTKLKLFFDWGIQFEKQLEMPDRGSRPVHYAGKQDLKRAILSQFPMIHMPMGTAMLPNVQTASKPMPAQININTEEE